MGDGGHAIPYLLSWASSTDMDHVMVRLTGKGLLPALTHVSPQHPEELRWEGGHGVGKEQNGGGLVVASTSASSPLCQAMRPNTEALQQNSQFKLEESHWWACALTQGRGQT